MEVMLPFQLVCLFTEKVTEEFSRNFWKVALGVDLLLGAGIYSVTLNIATLQCMRMASSLLLCSQRQIELLDDIRLPCSTRIVPLRFQAGGRRK